MKEIITRLSYLMIGILVLATSSSVYSTNLKSERKVDWIPATGLYWNPVEHGMYYSISVGPDAYVFVSWTLFQADGNGTYLVLQGQFEPSTITQWKTTGKIGSVQSSLYEMRGGACPGCTYQNPITAPSPFGSARIDFYNHGAARLVRNGREHPLKLAPLFTDISGLKKNRYQGRWHVVAISSNERFEAELEMTLSSPEQTELKLQCRNGDCLQWNRFFADQANAAVVDIGPHEAVKLLDKSQNDQQAADSRVVGAIEEFEGQLIIHNAEQNSPNVFANDYTIYFMRSIQQANAQIEQPIILPKAGLWWDRNQHGNFYHANFGPEGFAFVAHTSFDSNGSPDFFVEQGQFVRAAQITNANSNGDSIGHFESPIYQMKNGQCIDCIYRNSETVETAQGRAKFSFQNTFDLLALDNRIQNITIEAENFSVGLEPYPLYTSRQGDPINRLQGVWFAKAMIDGVERTALLSIETLNSLDLIHQEFSFPRDQRLKFACIRCDAEFLSQIDWSNSNILLGRSGHILGTNAFGGHGGVPVLLFGEKILELNRTLYLHLPSGSQLTLQSLQR